MLRILSRDSEIDPVFFCKLGGERPDLERNSEAEPLRRTPDPVGLPNTPLLWVSRSLCLACHAAFVTVFRLDMAPGGRFHEFAEKPSLLVKRLQDVQNSEAQWHGTLFCLCFRKSLSLKG